MGNRKKEMGKRENEIWNGKLHKQCYNKMEHLQYRMRFYIDFNVTALRFVQLTRAINMMNISKLHLYIDKRKRKTIINQALQQTVDIIVGLQMSRKFLSIIIKI